MHFDYDADADALYITLREVEGNVARTVEVDSSTNVDLDADGQLLGIEALAPSACWPLLEILDRWPQSTGDAAMLVNMYPWACSMSIARAAAVSG